MAIVYENFELDLDLKCFMATGAYYKSGLFELLNAVSVCFRIRSRKTTVHGANLYQALYMSARVIRVRNWPISACLSSQKALSQ